MKKLFLEYFCLFSANSNGIPSSITTLAPTITITEPPHAHGYVPADGCNCRMNLENDGTYVLAFCNTWTDGDDIYWCYIAYPSSSCSDHDIFDIDISINMAKAQCYDNVEVINGIHFLPFYLLPRFPPVNHFGNFYSILKEPIISEKDGLAFGTQKTNLR